MPKKLVVDRLISLSLSQNKTVTVPNDELWSVSIHESEKGAIAFNDGMGKLRKFARASIAGGTQISAWYSSCLVVGIAFKLQEV